MAPAETTRPETRQITRTIEIDVLTPPPNADAVLIAPRPFDHWGQQFHRFDVDGVAAVSEIGAENSNCRAYVAKPRGDAPITLRYEIGFCDAPAPGWVWETQANRYTTAAPSLMAQAKDLAADGAPQSVVLRRIIDDAAEIFGYAHVDEPFNQNCEEVPLICGTTKGSCVEINTYLMASALSLGVKSQYLIGYWFHPEKTETPDAHCWMVFHPDDLEQPVFWDLAHCIKWGPTLGATIGDGLNPAGGRRVAMSCGRGLAFQLAPGRVEISHFSEPNWVTRDPEGATIAFPSELRIRVLDPNGDRAQVPAGAATAAAILKAPGRLAHRSERAA